MQLIAFKNLISRNRLTENIRREHQEHQAAAGNQKPSNNVDENVAALIPQRLDRISLPFLVVSTNKKAAIDCNISKDKLVTRFHLTNAVMFDFNGDVLSNLQAGVFLQF